MSNKGKHFLKYSKGIDCIYDFENNKIYKLQSSETFQIDSSGKLQIRLNEKKRELIGFTERSSRTSVILIKTLTNET